MRSGKPQACTCTRALSSFIPFQSRELGVAGVQAAEEGIAHLVVPGRHLYGRVGKPELHPFVLRGMVLSFETGEFQAVRRRNNDDPPFRLHFSPANHFFQSGKSDPRVGTIIQSRQICFRRRLGQFFLGCLLAPLNCFRTRIAF
jgi:hypothetical protein